MAERKYLLGKWHISARQTIRNNNKHDLQIKFEYLQTSGRGSNVLIQRNPTTYLVYDSHIWIIYLRDYASEHTL